MKSEDFKELQEFCEQKGYQLLNESLEDNTKFFVVSKKRDEWEGVEFAECLESQVSSFTLGKIYRVNPNGNGVDKCDFCIDNKNYPNGFGGRNRVFFKPSNESVYKAQLEKMAFEKFGEIKLGDKFERVFSAFNGRLESPFTIDEKYLHEGEVGFRYNNSDDMLLFRGFAIYHQGVWATKLPERVKVEPRDCYQEAISGDYYFGFHIRKEYGEIGVLQQFLASALEKFLNNE